MNMIPSFKEPDSASVTLSPSNREQSYKIAVFVFLLAIALAAVAMSFWTVDLVGDPPTALLGS
jgi:hypothetical protein